MPSGLDFLDGPRTQFNAGSQQNGMESLRKALSGALQWPMAADKDPGALIRLIQQVLAPQSTPQDAVTGMMPGALGMIKNIGKPFIGQIPKSGEVPAIKHELGYILGSPNQHHGDLIKKYIREIANIPLDREPNPTDIYKTWRKFNNASTRYNDTEIGFVTSKGEFLTRKEVADRNYKFRQDLNKITNPEHPDYGK